MTIVVTGVVEARRSTIGKRLADRLGLRYSDAGAPTLLQAPPVGAIGVQVGSAPFTFPPELSDAEIVERVAAAHVRTGAPRGSLRAQAEDAVTPLSQAVVDRLLDDLVAGLGAPKRVLLLPPDATRAHSGAGELTTALYRRLSPSADVKILPALGSHEAMSESQLSSMFAGLPFDRFLAHDFRTSVTHLGDVPGSFVSHVSRGKLDFDVPCQLNREIAGGAWDRIISIGQLVPHEVVGIANHVKNVFIGTAGKESIDRSHFVGAVCGMEALMGRIHTPVRDILNYMAAQLGAHLPLTYLCTVRKKDARGQIQTHGLYAGDDEGCFLAGAPLAQQLNLELLERPLQKVVVYLDPHEFRTTWLGNKAIYRTRMAIADGGELTILGPGVRRFGEDPGIDQLIRRHGYRGTAHTLERLAGDPELQGSLVAAAHLMQGSSEGRFRVRWAAGGLSAQEVTGVGYEWADVGSLLRRYAPEQLKDGPNRLPSGEEIFFVSNPSLGLWALREKFGA